MHIQKFQINLLNWHQHAENQVHSSLHPSNLEIPDQNPNLVVMSIFESHQVNSSILSGDYLS